MEGTSYLGRHGGIRGVWETTPLKLTWILLLTLERCLPAVCPECFVEEGTVSVGVNLKFSRGVLRGRGNQGSERWHRLA